MDVDVWSEQTPSVEPLGDGTDFYVSLSFLSLLVINFVCLFDRLMRMMMMISSSSSEKMKKKPPKDSLTLLPCFYFVEVRGSVNQSHDL